MQVAYTQNAFIPICGAEFADNEHCGVWLEIHIRDGKDCITHIAQHYITCIGNVRYSVQ